MLRQLPVEGRTLSILLTFDFHEQMYQVLATPQSANLTTLSSGAV